MAQGTAENIDRNEKLVADYVNGMEIPLILAKYNISNKRMYDIVNRAGVEKRRKPRNNKKNSKGGEEKV